MRLLRDDNRPEHNMYIFTGLGWSVDKKAEIYAEIRPAGEPHIIYWKSGKPCKSEYYQKRSSLRNKKYSSKDKTTEVILEKKIPLFIDYYTAWVDDKGAINFRDDIYRRDKVLTEYLFPGN